MLESRYSYFSMENILPLLFNRRLFMGPIIGTNYQLLPCSCRRSTTHPCVTRPSHGVSVLSVCRQTWRWFSTTTGWRRAGRRVATPPSRPWRWCRSPEATGTSRCDRIRRSTPAPTSRPWWVPGLGQRQAHVQIQVQIKVKILRFRFRFRFRLLQINVNSNPF